MHFQNQKCIIIKCQFLKLLKGIVSKTIDSSDEADSLSTTLNSSVEQVDLSQRASVTSLEDLNTFESKAIDGIKRNLEPQGSIKKKTCKEEIESIIKKQEGDTTDPRNSKPTDCDLIELQKVKHPLKKLF